MGVQFKGVWWAALALTAAGVSCGSEKNPNSATAGGSSGDGGINVTAGTDGIKFDIEGGKETAGPGDCSSGGGGGGSMNEFSLIWIANSPEGTVSKIDTQTGMELGRYYTGPTEGNDDPSRTSVNLAGDVAVTNRGGGVAKFAARDGNCIDRNGNGNIDTSTGPNNVLAWGEDECMLWHQPTPSDGDNRHGPRPTAWDAGGANDACMTADDRLWVGWWDFPTNEGHFRRFSGADGSTLDDVIIPNFTDHPNYGPYGGAVDQNGDLWVVGLFGPLAFIDGETLMHDKWDTPGDTDPYGIALDANGHPWMGGWNGTVLHFDPINQQFEEIPIPGSPRMRGLMVDRNGYAWVAANNPCGVVQVDTATSNVLQNMIALPGCDDPVGVSIDIDGFVWLPDRGADIAFKVNPVSFNTTTTMGLVAPYTYSDMTGAGLGLVTNPPAG